jgi:uracil-DNA glycosylase
MKTWADLLVQEKKRAYFKPILDYVEQERAVGKTIYPPQEEVFNAFKLTEFGQVKVVIIGQDPYHGPGQAHGLCFSVLPGVKTPPSLVNIYKELAQDIQGFNIPQHGFLQSWAQQGVLLLNTVLTVEQAKAHSHEKIGWEQFTEAVIKQLNEHRDGLVFLLWGKHAQNKGALVNQNKHTILSAPHPSPLSAHRGFLGCKHFSQANQILQRSGLNPINWQP